METRLRAARSPTEKEEPGRSPPGFLNSRVRGNYFNPISCEASLFAKHPFRAFDGCLVSMHHLAANLLTRYVMDRPPLLDTSSSGFGNYRSISDECRQDGNEVAQVESP